MEGELDNNQRGEEDIPGNVKAMPRAVVLESAEEGWVGFPERLVGNHPGKSWGFGQALSSTHL